MVSVQRDDATHIWNRFNSLAIWSIVAASSTTGKLSRFAYSTDHCLLVRAHSIHHLLLGRTYRPSRFLGGECRALEAPGTSPPKMAHTAPIKNSDQLEENTTNDLFLTFGNPLPCAPIIVIAFGAVRTGSSTGEYCLMTSRKGSSWRVLVALEYSRMCWPSILYSVIAKREAMDRYSYLYTKR